MHISALFFGLTWELWEALWVYMHHMQSTVVAVFKVNYLAACIFKYFEHIIIGICKELLTNIEWASHPSPAILNQFSDLSFFV